MLVFLSLAIVEIIQEFFKLQLKLLYYPDILYLSVYPKDNMPQRCYHIHIKCSNSQIS